MIENILALDEQLFLLINGSGNETWDGFFLFLTNKLSWIPLYIFLVAWIIKENKKASYLILIGIGLLVLACDQGSVQLFKNVFERLRPCHVLENVRLETDGCGGQFGFVSSHASNVFGIAIFIGKILNKKAFAFLFLWAALVSYSRVYVGVHYPLDIIGGMIWGTTVALVLFNIYQKIKK